jgi:hypothetical protein
VRQPHFYRIGSIDYRTGEGEAADVCLIDLSRYTGFTDNLI